MRKHLLQNRPVRRPQVPVDHVPNQRSVRDSGTDDDDAHLCPLVNLLVAEGSAHGYHGGFAPAVYGDERARHQPRYGGYVDYEALGAGPVFRDVVLDAEEQAVYSSILRERFEITVDELLGRSFKGSQS